MLEQPALGMRWIEVGGNATGCVIFGVPKDCVFVAFKERPFPLLLGQKGPQARSRFVCILTPTHKHMQHGEPRGYGA